MMIFLVYTLIFWLAVAGFTLMLWVSIQPGNWLEKWQKQLREWDLAGKEFLYRIGGGCQICFCHAIAHISFLVYVAFFLATGLWAFGIIGSVIWFGLYICVSTNLNLYFITKLYK
jgi:uncharacterized membrane protein